MLHYLLTSSFGLDNILFRYVAIQIYIISHGTRSDRRLFFFSLLQLDELGRLVGNLCNIIPGGVICFFASYDYEKLVYAHWEKTGVIGRLAVKKKVHRIITLSTQG